MAGWTSFTLRPVGGQDKCPFAVQSRVGSTELVDGKMTGEGQSDTYPSLIPRCAWITRKAKATPSSWRIFCPRISAQRW